MASSGTPSFGSTQNSPEKTTIKFILQICVWLASENQAFTHHMQLTTFKIWVAHDKVLTSLGREIFGTVWFIVQFKLIIEQSEIKFHLRHNKNKTAL